MGEELWQGLSVVVGTVGRLADHMSSTEAWNLKPIQFFIMDEADRLLDLGCKPLPNCACSRTVAKLRLFANRCQTAPVRARALRCWTPPRLALLLQSHLSFYTLLQSVPSARNPKARNPKPETSPQVGAGHRSCFRVNTKPYTVNLDSKPIF